MVGVLTDTTAISPGAVSLGMLFMNSLADYKKK